MIVAGKVLGQTLAHFPGKVQSGEAGIFLLQLLDHAQALAVVLKPAVVFHQLVQYHLAFVPERGVAEVVRQRDGLRQVFVELERSGDVAGDGGDFYRVRQPRAQMVAAAVQEDLGFIFEPAKGARVNDAIAVALIMCAPVGRFFGVFASAGVGAELRVRREDLAFQLLQFFARAGHGSNSERGMRNSEWSGSCQFASNSCTETPFNSNNRRIASSIKLFGHDAPAGMPTVTLPSCSQSRGSKSCCCCR